MKKVRGRKGWVLWVSVVLFASFLIWVPGAFADEGAVGGGGDGKLTRFINKLKDPFTGLFPNIFSELSPADVGHKPRIRPHFAFNQGFISNARLGENQADAAWQARIAPGIMVSYPSGKLYTELDYTYGFSTTQGRKTDANVNTHNVSALARYDLSADTVIGVGNNLQFSEVPGQGGDTFVLETATAQVKHRLGPKLEASVSDTFQWFKDQTETTAFAFREPPTVRHTRDRELNNEFVDNGVNVGLNYEATSDLTAGPSFQWNIRNFEKSNAKDYWQIQPNLNASYKLGPKTTVSGNFGWAFRKFDENSSTSTGGHESELVYGISVGHLYGRKLVWSVSYAKTLQDTFDTSFAFKDTPESTTLDNLDRDFRVLKSHRIGSTATYNFNERNSFGVFGDVSFISGDGDNNVIRNAENNEKTMEVGAKYSYRINRYITFDVLYSFGRRFSAQNQNLAYPNRNEYTFHKVAGGVNIAV